MSNARVTHWLQGLASIAAEGQWQWGGDGDNPSSNLFRKGDLHMRKKSMLFVLFLVVFLTLQSAALAAAVLPEEPGEAPAKAKVALLYVNNAKATYDDEINTKMNDNFKAILANYTVVPGQPYIEKLNKRGIADITTVERADIMDVFKGEDIDYVLYVEIQPFIRKQRVTFFTMGMDMTTIVPMKIIDLKGNQYLYNGKFTEFASDSSMIGPVGNKSVAMKALDKTIEKMNAVIKVRLPLEPAAPGAAK